MNLNDVFGDMPERPNHPDFWRLSSIVLKYDTRIQAAATDDAKEKVWHDNVVRWVDEGSLIYMASQRAMRALGLETRGDLANNVDLMVRCTTLYSEGFQFGAEFATQHEFGDRDIDALNDTELRLLLSSYERHVMDYVEQGKKPLSVRNWYESWFGRGDD